MINEKIYQTIFDEISKLIPTTWEKLIIYLEYGEDAYSFAFYILKNGKHIKCYDILGISEEKIFDAFDNIDSAVSKERNKDFNEQWSNMTMLIDKSGNMHTDFDYTDLSSGAYQYKKAWKQKYLS